MPHLLKSLFPSLLLIAAYFIADEFLGPENGIYVALGLGTIELLHTRIREKRYDPMIGWTTLFFCLPGLLILLPENSLFARLQPAVIETGLCLLTGIFACSKADLTATLPASCRKELHPFPQQVKEMRRLLRYLFFLLSSHILLVYSAILFFPQPTTKFITSTLLYLLLGFFFAALYIRNHILSSRMKKEEWLPLVNEKGGVIGKAPRSICHSGRKLLHPVVHLHIIDKQHRLFLQKRSMKKDLLPGMWDTAVGGHIGWNEKVEDALKRETCEELGITDFEARFLGHYIWESPREREFVFSFLCTRYNQIRIANDEVDEGRFWTESALEQGIREETLTPNLIHEYQSLIKPVLHPSKESSLPFP